MFIFLGIGALVILAVIIGYAQITKKKESATAEDASDQLSTIPSRMGTVKSNTAPQGGPTKIAQAAPLKGKAKRQAKKAARKAAKSGAEPEIV